MTSLITSPRQEFSKKLPTLPVIEHPSSRRTDDNNFDLQIRGSSRDENSSALQESHGPLPPLKRRTSQRVSQGHSRVLTWPIGESLFYYLIRTIMADNNRYGGTKVKVSRIKKFARNL